MSESRILVRFLKNNTPYVIGDVTGIDGDQFKELAKQGVVEEAKQTKEAKESKK